MTHVLVRNSKVVKTIARDRPLRSEEKANGGARRQVVDGVTIYIGGTVTITDGKVSAITNPNPLTVAQQRRVQVKRWVGLAIGRPWFAWAGLYGNAQALQGLYWVGMIAKASSIDGNLTDNAKFAKLGAEMDHKPEEWLEKRIFSQWRSVASSDMTQFYSTQNDGGRRFENTIAMNPNNNQYGNFIKYLYS